MDSFHTSVIIISTLIKKLTCTACNIQGDTGLDYELGYIRLDKLDKPSSWIRLDKPSRDILI